MAERKSGPVKPPVIDLKARDASETPGTEAPAPEEAEAARPKPATSRTRGNRNRTVTATDDAGADTASAEPAAAEAPPAPAETATAPEPTAAPPPEPGRAPAAEQPEPAETSPAAVPPPPPRPPARLAMPWSAISVAALAGAVLGAGLTYLAANWIALPQQAPPFDDPAPALADLDAAAVELDARLAALEDLIRNTRIGLDATVAQLDATAGELRRQIADVAAAIPEPQTVDLSAIESELQTLESRVAAIAAGASSDDAAALAASLSGMETSLATLAGRLDGLETRLAEGDGRAATLAAGLEEARAAIAAQTRSLGGADIGPAVKLPLIVSGLEAAFAGGRSYAAELDGLTTLLPDLAVPEVIAASAATGLARPDALAARFTAALPDIIAGRARETTGDWAQDAIEWAKALLALRPAEEIEGDTPEAVVSRLEAAVGRRDFVAAAALLAQLPAPMRQAAGAVGTDIAALAQAETFIVRLRAQALAPATEPAS